MNYKNKLSKLLNQPRWKVVVFMLALNTLLLWQAAIDYYFYVNFNFLFARRAFFKSTRQRAHWVGSQIKPPRLASIALVAVLITGIYTAPHLQASMYWIIGWGTLFSLFVIYRSITQIFTAYRPHQRPQN